MKIKTIDRKHLLVVLSEAESRRLGLFPRQPLCSPQTKRACARVWEAASRPSGLGIGAKRLFAAISFFENRCFLLFSFLSARRFRIRGEKTLGFRFSGADALIDALRRMRREFPQCRISLYRCREGYFLMAAAPMEKVHAFRRLLHEYGEESEKSSAGRQLICEHGELLVSGKEISRLL